MKTITKTAGISKGLKAIAAKYDSKTMGSAGSDGFKNLASKMGGKNKKGVNKNYLNDQTRLSYAVNRAGASEAGKKSSNAARQFGKRSKSVSNQDMSNMTRKTTRRSKVLEGGLGNSSVNRNELARKASPESNKGLHRLDKARLEAYRAKKLG